MKIDVELAYLHNPHFHISGINGKNMGDRLDTRTHHDMVLQYDRDVKELYVTWGGREACIPESNVKSYFPFVGEERPKAKKVQAPVGAIKAQVSTPQDHVFKGPGGGVVRL